MQRRVEPELMDQAVHDREQLAESLRDLDWYNRHLGGRAAIIRQVGLLLDDRYPTRLSVLDVGAGGADILSALGDWLVRRKVAMRAVALDAGRETAKIARDLPVGDRRSIAFVCGDGRALPFADRQFDVTVCSTVLHHLETADAVVALREMARVSRLGIVASDLRRGQVAHLGALLLTRTVWAGHVYSRHDGPASVRAAFTLGEAKELAELAGLDAEVERQPLFRWALRWRRG